MNATITYDTETNNWVGMANGKRIVRSYDKTRVVKMMEKAGFANVNTQESQTGSTVEEVDPHAEWPISQRFGFVKQLVEMIAGRTATSAIITGPGGLGKTYTVMTTLEECGLRDVDSFETDVFANGAKLYKTIKGYSTARGLYRELFANKSSTIVFDDCDSILKDPIALNLLKGALDSTDNRVISWNSESKDEDIPRSFKFEGRVVFISNLKRGQIDQALLTRAYCVDLTMTTEQKLERMGVMITDESFMPQFEQEHKQESLNLICELGDKVKNINLRTLQAVTRIRAAGGDWVSLAKYVLTN